jgi:glyoxylase-like metal-dependent hydrolase (beta-lactamase superfamily II)
MVNFVYAIGDRESGQAILVDPAYAPDELVTVVADDGLAVVGVVATHYHFDHVGGQIRGLEVAGIVDLLDVTDMPIHVQSDEAPWITRTTGVGAGSLVEHSAGDVISVGEITLTLLHTPGHTPGSQCVLVDGRIVTGDTLFLEGCGRTDLPGSDPAEMYRTLTSRLADVPDTAIVYPGHFYSPEASASMGEVREFNYALAPRTAEEWLAAFGS